MKKKSLNYDMVMEDLKTMTILQVASKHKCAKQSIYAIRRVSDSYAPCQRVALKEKKNNRKFRGIKESEIAEFLAKRKNFNGWIIGKEKYG